MVIKKGGFFWYMISFYVLSQDKIRMRLNLWVQQLVVAALLINPFISVAKANF